MNLSPKAQTIVDALAIGGLTGRQVAELQVMHFELPDDEYDAIIQWTTLARQIRGIAPNSTEPIPEPVRHGWRDRIVAWLPWEHRGR